MQKELFWAGLMAQGFYILGAFGPVSAVFLRLALPTVPEAAVWSLGFCAIGLSLDILAELGTKMLRMEGEQAALRTSVEQIREKLDD